MGERKRRAPKETADLRHRVELNKGVQNDTLNLVENAFSIGDCYMEFLGLDSGFRWLKSLMGR